MTDELQDKHHLSSLFEVGAERLALIGKHAKALMEGYLQGEIEPSALSEQAARKLLAARVLYQPDESLGYKLRQPVTQLIAAMVTDENRRQINADVADKLAHIKSRVESFREAQRAGDYVKAELQLQLIHETVYDLTGQFEEAIHSLWHRLNSNFGFVSSLSDKIRENGRAQGQIQRLIAGLSLIDFNELIEFAEGHAGLRKLLVTKLQTQLNGHHASLLEVQKRLVELMGRFREQQARSLLVLNMASFLRQHPNFMVGDYSYRTQVPKLINQAAPIRRAAAVSLEQRDQQPVVVDIVHQLYRELQIKARIEPTTSNTEQVDVSHKDQEVEARQQQLKQDTEAFFVAAIDRSGALSALDYLEAQDLQWPPEAWLFQVIGEYNSLPRAQQQLFQFERTEAKAHVFNELVIIQDIVVRYLPNRSTNSKKAS